MKAYYYILIAFFLGSLKTAIAKSVSTHTPVQLLIFSQFFLCLLLLILISTSKEFKKIGFIFSQKLLVLSMRSLAGAAYWYFMFLSISYSSLFDISTLINLCPIWVLIISSLFFDKITIKNDIFFVAILGFIGSIFIIKPSGNILNFGAFLALLSGLCMALTIIFTKELLKTESSDTILICYFFVASLLFLSTILDINLKEIPTQDWVFIFINGLMMFFHQFFLNKGLAIGTATELSILSYFNIGFALVLDFIVWNNIPDIQSWIGALMILLSGVYIIKKQRI